MKERRTEKALLLLFVISVFLLKPETASARWATVSDADSVLEFENYNIYVKKDGTYTSTQEQMVRITRESGRSAYGLYRLRYNSNTSKLTIEEAKTVNDDGVFPVTKDLVEDKPLASRESGFDTYNQAAIAFPQIEVGSRLYLRTTTRFNIVPVRDFYSARFYFGFWRHTEKTSILIQSEIPLEIEANDPYNALTIQSSMTDAGIYHIEIQQNKPLFTMVLEEEDAYLDREYITWVVISSSKTYEDIAFKVAKEYEQRLNEPLPYAFEKILNKAMTYDVSVDRINAVTSLLADIARYVGDWREVRGGHIPRNLETIADTRFGDCKDLSLATAAIVRRLGYEAYIAWVYRGEWPSPLPTLPLLWAFNHAIVRVKADGRVFWIDPTNYASFAQGIFKDILDRQALIIHPERPGLERIPKGNPDEAVEAILIKVEIGNEEKTTIEAQFALEGRDAVTLTGLDKLISREKLKYWVSKVIAPDKQIISTEIEPVSLESRITKNKVILDTKVSVKNFELKTTAGYAFFINSYDLNSVMHLNPQKRVSDIFLGYPRLSRTETHLLNTRLVGDKSLSCAVKSRWLRASRNIKALDNSIVISEIREIKEKIIRNKDLKSEEFLQFQRQMQECLNNVGVVFEKNNTE